MTKLEKEAAAFSVVFVFGKAGFGKCGEGRRGGTEGPGEREVIVHVH